MIVTTSKLNLQDFLKLPNIDESPAWELLDGQAIQKPGPTFYHSTIQKRLVALIDASESSYEAFLELRCIPDTQSVVPDIAIVHQSQKPTGNVPLEMVFQSGDRFGLYRESDRLPVLDNLNLSLSPEQIFSWLL